MDRKLLNMRDTADRLNRTYEWFSRNRKKLQDDYGFPAPVPGMGNLYDPRAIDRWLDGFIHVLPGAPDPTSAGGVVDVTAELQNRARAIAQGLGDD